MMLPVYSCFSAIPIFVLVIHFHVQGLAMARSIGDDIAATVGVHATPEIKVHELTERDK
jgi:hypothetical protein